jgi:hypothetical protein
MMLMYYCISHDINNAYMTKSIFNLLFHQKTLVNRKAAIAVISLVLKRAVVVDFAWGF